MRKLSMQLDSRSIVGACRIFLRREKAEMSMGRSDLRSPFTILLEPMHAFEFAGFGHSKRFLVGLILSMVALAQVFSLVIQRIVILMIAFFVGTASENLSMHPYGSLAICKSDAPTARCVKRFGMRIPLSEPIPLIEPVKITGIHNGILSLRKWDKFYTLVRWLGNKVPFTATLWHGFPSRGNLCNAAILA